MLLIKAFACSYVIELKRAQSLPCFGLPAELFYHHKRSPTILYQHSGKPVTKGTTFYFLKLSFGKAEAFCDWKAVGNEPRPGNQQASWGRLGLLQENRMYWSVLA